MAVPTRKRNLSEEPREDGWEDHKDYMVIKRRKLRDQLEELGAQKSDIFNGVTIYVNGYTNPDADELREMIHTHGGHYEYAPSSRVTHMIATNLPAAKIKNLSETSIVCKPQWITDSIKTGLMLPIKNYELYNTSLKGQKEINFKAANKTSLDSFTTQNVSVSDVSQSKDFVSEFYSHSRLHYLSTWSAELKEFTSKMLPQSKRKIPLVPSGEGLRSKGVRAICHIDVDCFFVSVSIRDTPHLKGKPVAVTHAKKSETQPQSSGLSSDLRQSTSDIASCSYEAREYGIRNGMSVGEATRRCPNLVLVPYEFEKYRQVSQSLYEVMISYSQNVHFDSDVKDDTFGIHKAMLADAEPIMRHLVLDTGTLHKSIKTINLLPPEFSVRPAKNPRKLLLPKGHCLLLHSNYVRGSEEGSSFFVAVGRSGKYPIDKPYVIWHFYSLGSHVNCGAFFSVETLNITNFLVNDDPTLSTHQKGISHVRTAKERMPQILKDLLKEKGFSSMKSLLYRLESAVNKGK